MTEKMRKKKFFNWNESGEWIYSSEL